LLFCAVQKSSDAADVVDHMPGNVSPPERMIRLVVTPVL
jgi:hypothetical protein